MLPLIARGSQEVLLLVPGHLREGADALGVRRWRTVLGVVLPSALGGIVDRDVLAVARAAGETAPLILISSIFDPVVHIEPVRIGHGLDNIPVTIFKLSEQADPRASGARLGRRVRAAALHPLRQPRRARALPEPQQTAGGSPDDRHDRAPPLSGCGSRPPAARRRSRREAPARGAAARARRSSRRSDVSLFYGAKQALVAASTCRSERNVITALIGPVGLRQDDLPAQPQPDERLGPAASGIEGQVLYHGHDLYGRNVDRVEVRRRIGMVFQKPNPFPKSIYDNIAWAPRNLGMKSRPRRARRARAARRRALGRGQGPPEGQRARASPAASSSASASRARSRSSPTCCCSTSLPRRSTRSRPPRSRT